MKWLTPTNTLWRDAYGRSWTIGLTLAVFAHVGLFFFLPRQLGDRLHEALIPAPSVFVSAGSEGVEMEVVSMRPPSPEEPQPTPPPEPEPEEEVEEVTPSEDVSEEVTVAEVTEPASDTEGLEEGAPEGEGDEQPVGGGGGFVSPPRPIHLVVPRLPRSIDKRKARGEAVFLLVQVLSDGTVGEVRVEKGSRIEALNVAALTAARQMRYIPASRGGIQVSQWTRAEMRF